MAVPRRWPRCAGATSWRNLGDVLVRGVGWLGQRGDARLGRALPDAGHAANLLDRRAAEPAYRAELSQQGAPSYLPQPGHVVERARRHRAGTLLPVVSDREAVCLVAHALQ